MGLTRSIAMAVLLFPVTLAAEPLPIDIRAVGEHRLTAGDTAESVRAIARVRARRQAVSAASARLQRLADIRALRLAPDHLDAYVAAILETTAEDVPGSPGATRVVRVTLRASLDGPATAARIAALRRDQDVSVELLRAWTDLQRMYRELAAAVATERPRLVSAITGRYLTARAYTELARTEPATVGGRAIASGGQARARTCAEAALTVDPDSAAVHYALGDAAVEDERLADGERHYRTALAAAPSSAGQSKLAAALRYQDKLMEATAEAREAIRLDPGFARAHAELGLILRGRRQAADAIAAFREAVRLDPDLIEGHNGLAVSLANTGNLEGAVAEFREIIRIDPDSTIGYYNLASFEG